MSPKLLYVSFDIVPAPKGAAVHIEQFARALASHFGTLQLLTVAESPHLDGADSAHFHNPGSAYFQGIDFSQLPLAPGVTQLTLPAPGNNLIDRVVNFRRFLENWLCDKDFDIVQFRSPFEGYCLARHKGKRLRRLVFEVNGLPSIELKYRYPQLRADEVLLAKLAGQEQLCLEAADLIITPSRVTANYLKLRKGVDAEKLRIIPNAVDIRKFFYLPMPTLPEDAPLRLLYFGTLSPWQGVEQAVAAVALARQNFSVHLSIIASGKPEQLESLKDSVNRLDVHDNITILPPCSQTQVLKHIHDSHVVLAPLTANDRNLEQGCCPFKILESMAAGRPVLASSLPVVQEIAGAEPLIFLCKPGSPSALQDALLEMRINPGKLQSVASRARRRVEESYNLDQTGKLLSDLYEELLSRSAMSLSN